MESWVHVIPLSGNGNDTVSITVDANNNSENRTTLVEAKSSTLNKNLIITQKGEDMALNKIAFGFGEKGIGRISLNGIVLPDNTDTAQNLMALIKEAASNTTNTVTVIVGNDFDAVEYFYCNHIEDSGSFQVLTLGTHEIKLHQTDGVSLTY